VRARRADAWDAIVTLLVTLDTEQNHYFHAVMQGCRRLSYSRPEIDGLDDSAEGAGAAPPRRRDRTGATASAARLRDTGRRARLPSDGAAAAGRRRRRRPDHDESHRHGLLSRGWRRSGYRARLRQGFGGQGRGDADIPTSIEAVIELLAEAGVMPERPLALLEAATRTLEPRGLPILRRLMEFVLHHDGTVYLTRSRELAFLANYAARRILRSVAAVHATGSVRSAACICNLGLECWPAVSPGATSQGASSPRELDTAMPPNAFPRGPRPRDGVEVGWSVLYKDVSLFVTDQLMSTVADLHCADADTRRGLHALRRTLVSCARPAHRGSRATPPHVLAMLDMTAWISVLGLLDECPILPAALTAVLERRTTSVSPTAFEFISTSAQIGDIRLFMRTLPGLLSD